MKCCSGGVGDSGETDGVHRHLGREPLLHRHACSGPPPTGPASVQTPDLPVPNNHSDGGGFRCTGRGCGCVGGHNCHDCGGGGGGRTKAVQWQNITGRTKTMALRETAARLHARLAMQLVPALGAGVSIPVRSRRPRRRAWLAIPRPPAIHLGHRHGFAHTLHDGATNLRGVRAV